MKKKDPIEIMDIELKISGVSESQRRVQTNDAKRNKSNTQKNKDYKRDLKWDLFYFKFQNMGELKWNKFQKIREKIESLSKDLQSIVDYEKERDEVKGTLRQENVKKELLEDITKSILLVAGNEMYSAYKQNCEKISMSHSKQKTSKLSA